MEHFKIESQYSFSSLFIKTLVFFSLSALCFAGQENQTPPKETNVLFTLNKPVDFRWSGPYLGGYIGGAWGDSKVTTNTGSVFDTSYFASNANINAVAQNGSQTFIPSVFIGGVQLGDNWMYKNYVYGFVLDFGSLGLRDKKLVTNSAYPDGSGNYDINTSISTDWMYTIRGRLGWAPELSWPVMLYGTGGLAVTKLNVSNQFLDTTTLQGAGIGSSNNTVNGWSIGFGIEFPITQNLTMNGEYLFANFGSVTVPSSVYNSAPAFGGPDYQSLVSPLIATAHLYANFLKVGLNYKFNPGVVLHDQK